MGTDTLAYWESMLPVGEVIVFSRETPYARALAAGHAQVLDTVDPHTSERLVAAVGGDALPALCRRLLHAPSDATGADDRTLLLAELTPEGLNRAAGQREFDDRA